MVQGMKKPGQSQTMATIFSNGNSLKLAFNKLVYKFVQIIFRLMAKKKSKKKSSTRANPSSAQESPLSTAQREPHTGVSEACAKPVALQANPRPSSAQTAATPKERTWASLLKPEQQGPLYTAQREPHTGVSEACAKPVALQANPRPLSPQQGSSPSPQTAAAYVPSPSVANTTAAPAPAPQFYAEPPRSLKKFLENHYKWDEEQFKRGCQNMLRSLIRKIVQLEELKGITRGPLNGENILVIGNNAENLKVEILNTPSENNPDMRQQFLALASEVVLPWKATHPLAWKHFLDMIEKRIDPFYFKQLEWHPLLLSTKEQAMLITRAYRHLEIECKGWKKDYRTVTKPRDVDIGKTVGTAFGFYDVYTSRDKFGVIYEPNPLGALVFYRHAHKHVNDYIYENQKNNGAKPELIKDALLTTEQKGNKLAHFFPEVALELFNYMLIKGIDIEKAI
ncbi:uncharacterized protein Pyn_04757 [Prunus yedoensis var. nudiflora]|uniref:Uncharacterized protein n=1 Tax=Prunus yedoensis var. nudiflora TaxID=2094558 RepID=A0A314ZIL9_PRUYE|nr:uncharacterized protein Pyn_04757 [Prunus yedoensis var. nudiflora]